MSSEPHPILRIGDFAQVKGGKRMPAGTALTSDKTSHPYLRIVDFKDGSIDTSNLQYVPDAVFPQISRYVISAEDLYISIVGTIGLVGAVPASLDGANLTENAAKICGIDRTRVNTRYLSYYLRSDAGQSAINALTVGSTQPKLALFRIEQIEVPVPSLNTQQSIADMLGALDDRITLLRETNATLEAIAQALFKSWFVDFDPVRAKMEGRTPEGMDEATAALFPDGFETSELGEVPRGWRVETLGSMSSYMNRGLSPKYLEAGGVLVLNQKCIRDFSVDFAKGRRHDPSLRKIDGREVAVGDVLVNSTGVGTLGRVAQVLYLPEPIIVDSHVTVVRAGPDLSWPYLGQFMARKQPEIEAMGEGSTGQTELGRAKLASLSVVVPSMKVLTSFDELVRPLKQRVAVNESKAQTLSTLRDTLLPRLISGQLRLDESAGAIHA